MANISQRFLLSNNLVYLGKITDIKPMCSNCSWKSSFSDPLIWFQKRSQTYNLTVNFSVPYQRQWCSMPSWMFVLPDGSQDIGEVEPWGLQGSRGQRAAGGECWQQLREMCALGPSLGKRLWLRAPKRGTKWEGNSITVCRPDSLNSLSW